MDENFPVQALDPTRTTWHITIGTHGARLHGGDRPTVDRLHNHRGEPFIERDERRERGEHEALRADVVVLPRDVREFIEQKIPAICRRGGWTYRTCAAPEDEDHVHTLLDAIPAVHGKDVRKWLKRWLSEGLNERFGKPAAGEWWAECGSTKPVEDVDYLNNVFAYVCRQRTTSWKAEA